MQHSLWLEVEVITEQRTLLTIITEAAIESRLIKDLDALGMRGYTIVDVRGKGSRGVRDGQLQESANIRIETVVTQQKASNILRHLAQHYYDHYAMIAFMRDVEILRPAKFD